MPTEYAPDEKLQAEIQEVIANEQDPYVSSLRNHDINIIGVFVQKTNNKGEAVRLETPVSLKKVPDFLQHWVHSGEQANPARFVLLVDYPTWEEANPKQRLIMLHEVLSLVKAEKADNGEIKVTVGRLPFVNPMTVAIYGSYNSTAALFGDLFASKAGKAAQSVVGQLMGQKSEEPKSQKPVDGDGEEDSEDPADKDGEKD